MKKFFQICIIFLLSFMFVSANDDDGGSDRDPIDYRANITLIPKAKFLYKINQCGETTEENKVVELKEIGTFSGTFTSNYSGDSVLVTRTIQLGIGNTLNINALYSFRLEDVYQAAGIDSIETNEIYEVNLNIKASRRYIPVSDFNNVFDLGEITYFKDNSNCPEGTGDDRDSSTVITFPPVQIDESIEITDDFVAPSVTFTISDSEKCIRNADVNGPLSYSCYANEELNFDAKILEKGNNPGGVNQILFYVLNPEDFSLYQGSSVDGYTEDLDDTKEIDFSQNIENSFFEKVGKYSLEVKALHTEGNGMTSENTNIYLEIVPNPEDLEATVQTQEENGSEVDAVGSGDNVYGNYSDFYTYKFKIVDKFGNPINGKKLKSLKCIGEGCISEKEVGNQPSIEVYEYDNLLDENGIGEFKIRSAVPGDFAPDYEGVFIKWNQKYETLNYGDETKFEFEGGDKTFKEPLIWDDIKVQTGVDDSGNPTYGDEGINVEVDQSYKMILENIGNLIDTKFSLANIYNGDSTEIYDKDNFEITPPEFEISEFDIDNIYPKNLSTILENTFKAKIKSISDSNLFEGVEMTPKDLHIGYKYSGDKPYNIRYPLNTDQIKACSTQSRMGVKIEGFSEGFGKVDETGESDAITDVSVPELRNEIRKNATELIRNNSGGKVGDIYYVNGNLTLTDTNKSIYFNDVDTLIIKNGNLTIATDLDFSTPKGIIVLSDNYNVENNPVSQLGNIFVNNNVSDINANIYAEGAILSSNDYSDDELRTSLVINGSLFTRNTIGGGSEGSNGCMLPGGIKNAQCGIAEKYDLNKLRKTFICAEDDYSLKIKYDPSIKTNPPKGFAN